MLIFQAFPCFYMLPVNTLSKKNVINNFKIILSISFNFVNSFELSFKNSFCYTLLGGNMYLSKAVKERIYELCDERNITINKLCMICGITQSTLANINARPNTNLTILTIMRICRGLEISIQEFFNSPLFEIDTLDDD